MKRHKADIDDIRAAMRANFAEIAAHMEHSLAKHPERAAYYRAQQLFFRASEEFTVAFVECNNEGMETSDILEAGIGTLANMGRNLVTNHSEPEHVPLNYLALVGTLTNRLLDLWGEANGEPSDGVVATAQSTVKVREPH